LEEMESARYVPTGVQEEIIAAVGSGAYRIVYVSGCNKVGKTCAGANVLRNIAYMSDKEWFDYPLYNRWPYPKSGRIIGTPKNISDDGPIRKELKKWLPKYEYTESKGGKPYYSQYDCKTGFYWDVMSYEQDNDEFEGSLIGFCWCDEPPPARLMGAIMSRFSKGGVLLVTATPVGDNVGPFLDVLDDLEAKGTKVCRLSCDLMANSVTSGRPNSKGTKLGLMTDVEIQGYISTIPKGEREARVYGRPDHKMGKIVPEYNEELHVRDVPIDGMLLKRSNCYLSMDPHRKYYPAIQCWAVTPSDQYICYNEWPTYEMMGAYYSDYRNMTPCPYTFEDLARFIKAVDGSKWGLHVLAHIMDPFYAAGTMGEGGNTAGSIITDFAAFGLDFMLPPRERKAKQRDRIRVLLHDDTQRPVPDRGADIIIARHCINTRRAFDRHYWASGKADEAEEYKDFFDTARNFFAYIEGTSYKDVQESSWGEKKESGGKVVSFDDILGEYGSGTLRETGLR